MYIEFKEPGESVITVAIDKIFMVRKCYARTTETWLIKVFIEGVKDPIILPCADELEAIESYSSIQKKLRESYQ